jgi:hypothetical protein
MSLSRIFSRSSSNEQQLQAAEHLRQRHHQRKDGIDKTVDRLHVNAVVVGCNETSPWTLKSG